jgi:hypothetical protein
MSELVLDEQPVFCTKICMSEGFVCALFECPCTFLSKEAPSTQGNIAYFKGGTSNTRAASQKKRLERSSNQFFWLLLRSVACNKGALFMRLRNVRVRCYVVNTQALLGRGVPDTATRLYGVWHLCGALLFLCFLCGLSFLWTHAHHLIRVLLHPARHATPLATLPKRRLWNCAAVIPAHPKYLSVLLPRLRHPIYACAAVAPD